MKLTGRLINGGKAEGPAVVLENPFSFIGDFDPDTGKLVMAGHPLHGQSLANKILVCPTGKGGTIAPFVAYNAKKAGNTPVGILCNKAEPITCESAITIDVPMLDQLNRNPVDVISSGQWVIIENNEVTIVE